MGEPKQLLPWGATTILGAVVEHLLAAGAAPVLCVVGHRPAEVAAALAGSQALIVANPDFVQGEMLSSYQAGVKRLLAECEVRTIAGTLLALGDQPHIPAAVIQQVIVQARQTPDAIVIPSHNLRRGHPFYLPARLWPELLTLPVDETLRTLVRRHEPSIVYVNVESDAILRDIDTPADYANLNPPQP
jgi:molybdenum cofactor cytidylyltransferase